ncbi:MAG: large conductance mechanosensitive channel protein MscL [Solirubrobacteraceae bacterium]|jgi:large conductance mechanosensitive channel|nr:large conductance mechanosensitive channel protein MscL [Solirubrobacteraceae bacterium]MDP4672855.1 large conductance mechanosensitive channel protein MscL [Solirubrobacteraceae bacterium]MDP4921678.1 large conductance mechanosensitive channel protein MscL [Solirubrobacteraceae bacterium]
MIKEFRDFLLRGNVVDLAVAVVIGAAFAALVNSLVADLLTPVVGAIIGKPDFSDLSFTINDSQFNYGSFLNALVAFVSVAAAVFFFVVKPMNTVNRLRGASSEEVASEIELLTEIRDELRSQRGAS